GPHDAGPAFSDAMIGTETRATLKKPIGMWRNALSGRALQRLRRQLDERERELRTKILDERHRVQDEALAQLDDGGDLADRAFLTTQVSMERDFIDRCMHQLDEIARTRDRIPTGDLGILKEH